MNNEIHTELTCSLRESVRGKLGLTTAPLFCSIQNTVILEFGHRGKMAITLLAYCSEAFTLLAYSIMAL